ncbi:MAG: hypothetical protein Ct9H300mP4_02100 [Gammaproteobacteria bacterium]|nr:MAG: hypothetical protein Ct9H300mP4_02100 [Gammaproteobacteria bacterium]
MFAFEHSFIRPDGLILGKHWVVAASSSCFLSSKEVMQWFTPGSHGSTFGGFSLAAAIGKRSIELIEEEQLAQNSMNLGNYFPQSIKGNI